ncbi:response regulator [Metabacillus halosaccharovorans]|uniref:response regulator n=1 Tax=Metabacillus halosaccharovorans TaxID=930124 RepID=UPI00403DFBE5
MKIKMLIVDDEPIISQGLRMTIPWDSHGIEVIGEASDGKHALEILEKQKVDIVLTDVRMPEMDGIKLAKTIYEQMPHIRVIIISGYDDFHYAREAIRFRVKDYLLKPVDIEELVSKVSKLAEEINYEREVLVKVEEEQMQEYVEKLLFNPQFKLDTNQLFTGLHFCVIVSQLEEHLILQETYNNFQLDKIREDWNKLIHHAVHAHPYRALSFFTHPNILMTLLFSEHDCTENDVKKFLNNILSSWKEPTTLSFGVSNMFADIQHIKGEYEHACEALLKRDNKNGRIHLYSLLQENNVKKKYSKINYLSIYETIFRRDSQQLSIEVDQLFDHMEEGDYNLVEIVEVCHELNNSIQHRLNEILTPASLENQFFRVKHTLDLHYYNSAESIKKLMLTDLEMWMDLLMKESTGKKSWSVEKAEEYILENFHRDLKASEVANEIHITPNYFSMIFKKELGVSFNDYLNDLRIEKAKQLLSETSDRIFEIAKEVGYKEYKYFVQVFRKKTGMTPTDYRTFKGGSHSDEGE